ncbi:MAG: type II toxin-antitoxin system death-on-curing family toxin [Chitinophagales bacterium]|nr:type II toxin-antitoxin system death-on-curing family toxin [Chitinophagales bacterium]
MDCKYFDLRYAIKTHDKILEVSGGNPGIIDEGRLESSLTHIQNDDYYPMFVDKLTHIVYEINKGHNFNDGNKRTSVALGAFFLELNGFRALVDKFIIGMENIAVSVADNLIDKKLLKEIMVSLLSEPEYNEELKLKIIHAIS